MSTNTKHKYNSPMKRIYYQSSSGGRPRDPSGDSEAMDLAKSLINFSDEIRQTAYANAETNKKEAQVVFDTLKAQGITDPDEIKTLIEKDDERVKPLKKRYTQSVIDSNFGLSHAVQDFKLLNKSSLSRAVNFCNLNSRIAFACSSSNEILEDEDLKEGLINFMY